MPLLDHFRPPTDDEAPWEAIGSLWVSNVVRSLNRLLPKDEFRAFANVHLGHMIEADVAEFQQDGDANGSAPSETGGSRTAVLPAPVLTFVPEFPDEFEVRIQTMKGTRRVVAVIEFVSPSNKDREETRQKFLMKCVGYAQMGIGLVIVDTVTSRLANLHNELLTVLGRGRLRPMADTPTYVASYRPCGYEVVESFDVWAYPALVGLPLPSVPLPLKNGPDVMIDLEATYIQTLEDQNIQ
jgi:hypothetical protein